MQTSIPKTAQLGDVIAAAFDEASQYTKDPRLLSRLATGAVLALLRHAPAVRN